MNAARYAVVMASLAWLGGLACAGRDLPGAQAQEKQQDANDSERQELELLVSRIAPTHRVRVS